MERCGAVWSGVELCGAVWSGVGGVGRCGRSACAYKSERTRMQVGCAFCDWWLCPIAARHDRTTRPCQPRQNHTALTQPAMSLLPPASTSWFGLVVHLGRWGQVAGCWWIFPEQFSNGWAGCACLGCVSFRLIATGDEAKPSSLSVRLHIEAHRCISKHKYHTEAYSHCSHPANV